MLQELEQLRQLVFTGGFDAESRKDVVDIERRLHEAAAKENLAEHPVIKPFVDYLQGEIDRCELLLRTDRKLTDRERDELFARIDICDRFTSLFNGKQREAIEKTIKEMLNVAKTR
jgi:hypothetical protein